MPPDEGLAYSIMGQEQMKAGVTFEVPGTLLNGQWTYGRWKNGKPLTWKSAGRVVAYLIAIAAKNGNFLLNIPPMATGKWSAEAEKFFADMASWMQINGEAMSDTTPVYPFQGETNTCLSNSIEQLMAPAVLLPPQQITMFFTSPPLATVHTAAAPKRPQLCTF